MARTYLEKFYFPLPYLYSGALSFVQVFVSWHFLHKACQLLRSQNNFWSPRCGMMWSTTVALVYSPSAIHLTHSGWASRYFLLAFCHFEPYPRAAAEGRSSMWRGLCFPQYFPFETSSGQPGCWQGVLGLVGICFITSHSWK